MFNEKHKSLLDKLNKISFELSEIKKLNEEILWAFNYSDSIRSSSKMMTNSLNVGRWAGNYTFFYVLTRVLLDSKPSKIIEFGLGESTKHISTYLEEQVNINIEHVVIEHDQNWIESFKERFPLTPKTKIIRLDLCTIRIENHDSIGYTDIDKILDIPYDLYVIDGPFGSDNYSRADILQRINSVSKNEEFIIIFDDVNRIGEQQTLMKIFEILNEKKISFHQNIFGGVKNVAIICSDRYRYLISI